MITIFGKIRVNLLERDMLFLQDIQTHFKDDVRPIVCNRVPGPFEHAEFMTVRIDFNQIDPIDSIGCAIIIQGDGRNRPRGFERAAVQPMGIRSAAVNLPAGVCLYLVPGCLPYNRFPPQA